MTTVGLFILVDILNFSGKSKTTIEKSPKERYFYVNHTEVFRQGTLTLVTPGVTHSNGGNARAGLCRTSFRRWLPRRAEHSNATCTKRHPLHQEYGEAPGLL
jgi:hypothetical protein